MKEENAMKHPHNFEQAGTAPFQALSSSGLIELLESDPRPSFVLDLEDGWDSNRQGLQPTFANGALRRHPSVSKFLYDEPGTYVESQDAGERSRLVKWASEATVPTLLDGDLHWSFSTIQKRWRVFNGNDVRSDGAGTISSANGVADTAISRGPTVNGSMEAQRPKVLEKTLGHCSGAEPAWVKILPDDAHIQFFKSTDWSATPFGPLEAWSSLLRQTTQFLMADSRPACVFWGSQKVVIYNEPYIAVASKKHPTMMGSTLAQSWAEIATDLAPAFSQSEAAGRAETMEDTPFFIERNGYLEETFFSFNLIPICDQSATTHGFYNTAIETTRQKVWERRASTLLSMVTALDLTSYWKDVLSGLEPNDLDIPLAAIYSLDRLIDQDWQNYNVSFEGGLGITENHPLAVKNTSLGSSSNHLVRIFREAVTRKVPRVLHQSNGDIPEGLLDHEIRWRGFGEKSTVVVVVALFAAKEITGFLLLGLNPRRAYDEDYDGFIQLLSRQLSTACTSAVFMEQAKQRQAKLSQDVAESESRFKALTELNSAGLFYISPTGSVLYANDTWYEMTGFRKGVTADMAFMDVVLEDDRAYISEQWHGMAVLQENRTFEFRLKKKWYHQASDSWKDLWMLACCGHQRNEDGSFKSVMGCITDISLQKQAEGEAVERARLSEKLARSEQEANEIQMRSVIEAEDARKSMENFMDITSHEMRNPLSAILQSADGITTSLLEYQASPKTSVVSDELVESNLEAVQIITLCAQHQGRIINDVLTLSKLDSAMLQVSPIPVQPPAVVKGVLKMFEGELLACGIELEFTLEKSFTHYAIDWVLADPSRLTQILVNLMTNAIKFTQSEATRRIKVSIGGSDFKPPNGEKVNLEWFPSRGAGSKRDLTIDEEWGKGEDVYLYFAVQDSGRGLTDEEKRRLFHRFAQANPRTHVKYGGSGLGLFISRELTELHGGEIGLYSEAGKGSTFAFYVKGKRTTTPEQVSQRDGVSEGVAPSTEDAPNSRPVTLPTRGKSPKRKESSALQVLLVEDNLVNQKVLRKQLTKAGCVVHVANHGLEALENLEKSNLWKNNVDGHALDVVLMDLEMPVMDGLTCARRIRELQTDGSIITHVPLIAVTANARKEQIETSMAAGMDDVMPKPFRVAELLPKMEKLRTSRIPVLGMVIEQPLKDANRPTTKP